MKSTGVREVSVRRAKRFVQAAGLIFYILAVQGLIAAGVGAHVYFMAGDAPDLVLPATGGLLAICYAAVGFSLRRYRLSARNFAFAFAVISLFAFPVGTVLGSLIVVCIDRANRAGIFPQRRRPEPAPAEEAVENAPLLVFEPGFALPREQAG
jgi:hypothetical protein